MALKDYVTEWGQHFNAATLVFSKDIAKATKEGRETGGAVNGVLSKAKTGTAGVVGSLGRLAKFPNLSGAMDDKTRKATLDGVAKELKTLGSETKKYATILDAAINGEIKVGFTKPEKIKDCVPESYRQLKLLKTELAAILARATNEYKGYATAKQTAKIGEKQQKGMDKARKAGDEDKAKEIEAEARLKKLLVTLAESYRSSMAKGAAVIQRVKASPTVATYNKEMDKGGRDISQNIVNIAKMKTSAGLKDLKEVKALPAPGALATEIEQFANGHGALRVLPSTATKTDVEHAIAQFSALHKRITATYKNLAAVK